MVDKVLFSSECIEWETPKWLFDQLDRVYHFTLDPCCRKETAKCKKYYTEEDDGLTKSWSNEVVFMNPPYGREISKWIEKAYNEAKNSNAIVVCLLPARTDTKYFHNYCVKGQVQFIKGRLKFKKWVDNGEGFSPLHDHTSAPFPSMIVVFGVVPYNQDIQYNPPINPNEV